MARHFARRSVDGAPLAGLAHLVKAAVHAALQAAEETAVDALDLGLALPVAAGLGVALVAGLALPASAALSAGLAVSSATTGAASDAAGAGAAEASAAGAESAGAAAEAAGGTKLGNAGAGVAATAAAAAEAAAAAAAEAAAAAASSFFEGQPTRQSALTTRSPIPPRDTLEPWPFIVMSRSIPGVDGPAKREAMSGTQGATKTRLDMGGHVIAGALSKMPNSRGLATRFGLVAGYMEPPGAGLGFEVAKAG